MSAAVDRAPAAITASTFTQTGNSFARWNNAAEGSGTAYGDEASYPFSATATPHAQ